MLENWNTFITIRMLRNIQKTSFIVKCSRKIQLQPHAHISDWECAFWCWPKIVSFLNFGKHFCFQFEVVNTKTLRSLNICNVNISKQSKCLNLHSHIIQISLAYNRMAKKREEKNEYFCAIWNFTIFAWCKIPLSYHSYSYIQNTLQRYLVRYFQYFNIQMCIVHVQLFQRYQSNYRFIYRTITAHTELFQLFKFEWSFSNKITLTL